MSGPGVLNHPQPDRNVPTRVLTFPLNYTYYILKVPSLGLRFPFINPKLKSMRLLRHLDNEAHLGRDLQGIRAWAKSWT